MLNGQRGGAPLAVDGGGVAAGAAAAASDEAAALEGFWARRDLRGGKRGEAHEGEEEDEAKAIA